MRHFLKFPNPTLLTKTPTNQVNEATNLLELRISQALTIRVLEDTNSGAHQKEKSDALICGPTFCLFRKSDFENDTKFTTRMTQFSGGQFPSEKGDIPSENMFPTEFPSETSTFPTSNFPAEIFRRNSVGI